MTSGAPERAEETGSALGRVLMVQGTSSHAGKTTLVAALCRIFARAGYRVAPFKAQNMSNNAAVTDGGGEIGRAQALQALAAGVPITVDMNPVLLKPQSDRASQVVVLGRARTTRDARAYYDMRAELWPVVTGALDRLRASYDLVVIEGAGSPAEINLARYDIVNMSVARHAGAPVFLVGDIERGGVFAALYGTTMLLPEAERALIRGFIINKFRGDASLLDPGFEMLEERTGIPTLGVLPYLELSGLPAEDAVDWGAARARAAAGAAARDSIDIAVAQLPRVANLDELQPLARETGVRLRFVRDAAEMGEPDLIIIPGTKSTLADLHWLRERGLERVIRAARERGTPILGICGGFQMLGRRISDAHGVESSAGEMAGLELLPFDTAFAGDKVTRTVTAVVAGESALWGPGDAVALGGDPEGGAGPLGSADLSAYEIHMGRTEWTGGRPGMHAFEVRVDGRSAPEGMISEDGLVVGSYMHGLLENAALRTALLRRLAARRGVARPAAGALEGVDAALGRLADSVCRHLDVAAMARACGLELPRR